VLLLAGTAEASALARMLVVEPGVEVEASLAGRTRRPAELPCPVRTGGFGGVAGLSAWLRAHRIDAVVDATHPFAAVMPHNAAAAAAAAGASRVRLLRPPWAPTDGDRWHEVATLADAAATVERLGAHRVLLTTGRLDLEAFAGVRGARFVVRSIEAPGSLPWSDAVALRDRGPYTVEGESALLREHAIDALVTKNSGGEATAAKLAAARSLGLPVVVVGRPPSPPGPVVASAADALAWLRTLRSPATR
jgi:precorrin-6A/cobalt-precorrin-6A reductase